MTEFENNSSLQEMEGKHESQTPESENAVNSTEEKKEAAESSATADPVSPVAATGAETTTPPNAQPVTVKLEDLTEEAEYSSEEVKKFQQIYESTISRYTEGEIVKGKILSLDNKEISVDIGFKSEGIVPFEEFGNIENLKIGDEIEVLIDNIEDKDGQLILSRKKADFMRAWDKVVEYYEKGETLQGRITRRIKGGMVVDLMGVEAFLPGSQIDVKPIRDFDALVGEVFDFKVVNVNQMRKNIVVSRRVMIEEEMKDQRSKILNELQKGQILDGSVKNITDFGVFIDLGGVDGLLHINDLSWGRIGHPSEVVSLDQKIKVMVLDFDEAKTRISLGYKQMQPHPWENVEQKYPVGKKVTGKVVNIADYGAFIELERGIEGLVHISEMSWTQHIKHPTQLLSLGDMIEAIVLNVEKDEHKISLGLKQLQPDPWAKIEENYPVGTRHKGIVRNLTNFGAFIELEEGVDGLVHISDLSWTRKVRHPSEVIKKADEIEVEVLAIDKENRRISLGYKQIFENPWDVLENRYKVGCLVKGKVTRCIDKGVVVEIPEEVEGFVPLSHLARIEKPGFKRTSDLYKLNDELNLVVIEFDKNNKRIVLSEKPPEELQNVPSLKEEEKYPDLAEEESTKKKRGKAKEPQPEVVSTEPATPIEATPVTTEPVVTEPVIAVAQPEVAAEKPIEVEEQPAEVEPAVAEEPAKPVKKTRKAKATTTKKVATKAKKETKPKKAKVAKSKTKTKTEE